MAKKKIMTFWQRAWLFVLCLAAVIAGPKMWELAAEFEERQGKR